MKTVLKTAYQKIVESHTAMVLPDGRLVLRLDCVWGHEITSPNAFLDMEERGIDVVSDRKNIKMMIDHVNPAGTTESAIQGRIVREWSKKHGVEFLEVGRNGICHAIIPEKGWILPGQIGIMGDSHTCTHGAVGAFTAGVGTTELEAGIITGLFICQPQKVIRVNFVGDLPANVFAKDLILALIHKIGVKGATNAVLEFGGPVIDGLSMEARMTITNMAVEAGATSGMMPIDLKTIGYLWPILWKHRPGITLEPIQVLLDLDRFNSDPGVQYDRLVEINVSEMTPLTTINYSPGEVVAVAVLARKSVDQVVIGSCTNGRIEDLWIAASIFRQTRAKVAENTRCIIIPATQYIYEKALREGLVETFLEAGCFVNGPTCGPCLGMSCGVIAPGEVCLSTTNRNFNGRMGKGGMVHLASPATAAMTAITGSVAVPDIKMCQRAVKSMFPEVFPGYEPIRPSTWKGEKSKRPDYAALLSQAGEDRHPDFSGQAFYLPGDSVNTDQIIPAKYLNEVRKEVFGAHCLEDVITEPVERAKFQGSRILVAGENFGCGSSREHAAWAFQGLGIGCVIAPSFARIFKDNMFAIGLLCITLPKDRVEFLMREKPEYLTIDWEHGLYGTVRWGDHGAAEERFVLDEYQKKLIRKGGSVIVTIELAAELQAAGKL